MNPNEVLEWLYSHRGSLSFSRRHTQKTTHIDMEVYLGRDRYAKTTVVTDIQVHILTVSFLVCDLAMSLKAAMPRPITPGGSEP